MLKHSDVIEKLDKLQKVALIASVFNAEQFEKAGVPPVRIASLNDMAKASGVSYVSVVRSWNPELVGKMTEKLIADEGVKNNLFVSPDLKAAVNPFAEGLSEDAFFNGEMGAEMICAAHEAGAAVGLAEPSLSKEEIAYLDVDEDPVAVHELFVAPFLRAVYSQSCEAVVLNPSREGKGYYETNRSMLSDVQNGLLGEDVFVIGEGETFTPDAIGMLNGKITLGGCSIPLERAVRRYTQLKAYRSEGSVTDRDIEDALLSGNAIDDVALDELVDNIIDFALTLDALELKTGASEANDAEREYSSEEAIATDEQNGQANSIIDIREEVSDAHVKALKNDNEVSNVLKMEYSLPQSTPGDAYSEKIVPKTTSDGDAATMESVELLKSTPPDQITDGDVSKADDAVEANAPAAIGSTMESETERLAVENEKENLSKRLAQESFVLLKNKDSLLPLKAGDKVAVLGGTKGEIDALKAKFTVVGKAKGYEMSSQRSDSLIPAALRVTQNASAVIVFLHPSDDGSLALPANRLALIDALSNARKRVVAIVCGDKPVDLSFDRSVEALLLAPKDCDFAGEALAEILCGEEEPSGRLVRTYYDAADEFYRKYRADRDSKAMKIGSFIGYRREGIDKTKIRYPFGFGLSYTKFGYSDLALSDESVSFTLKNCGERDGYEVAQIYIGVPGASHATPKKQLRAFCKVFLHKGESRKITVTFPISKYETFDPDSYAENIAEGEYVVYVGSSSLDIRLQGKKVLSGVQRKTKNYTLADYSPDGEYRDVSLVDRSYRIAKAQNVAPKNLRKLRKIALYSLPVLALLFFLSVSVIIVAYGLNYILLNKIEKEAVEQCLFLSALAAIGLLPFLSGFNRKRLVQMRNVACVLTPILIAICFVVYGFLLKDVVSDVNRIFLIILACITVGMPILAIISILIERQLWRNKMGKNRWEKYYFELKNGLETTSDEEFEEAMAMARARKAATLETVEDEPVIVAEVPQFYDKRLTYDKLLADCKLFTSEHGLVASEQTLCDYIAALSCTQLIFVRGEDGWTLVEMLAQYLGRDAYVDNAENYTRFDDMFVKWRSGGYVNEPTEFARALEKAVKESVYMHTVFIRHVDKKMLQTLFEPIAEVVSKKRMAFTVGEKSVRLPANLLIVAELDDGEVLPKSVAEVSAVIDPLCKRCEPAEQRTVLQTFGFERINAMRRYVRDEHPLDEESWRLVDALSERSKSHIGNNLWNRIEMHASISVACMGVNEGALDCAIATELLPWLTATWESENPQNSLANALSEIFGADKLEQSIAQLKNSDEV